jgi:hypothetical protein
MAETKPALLTLITAYVQGRMTAQTHMIIPDFCIWRRKNGLDQTRMIIPDFCIWRRKNGLDQTRMIIPDFFI